MRIWLGCFLLLALVPLASSDGAFEKHCEWREAQLEMLEESGAMEASELNVGLLQLSLNSSRVRLDKTAETGIGSERKTWSRSSGHIHEDWGWWMMLCQLFAIAVGLLYFAIADSGEEPQVTVKTESCARLPYLDAVKVFMTVSVVLHHVLTLEQIYGLPDWWLPLNVKFCLGTEAEQPCPEHIFSSVHFWLCGLNQAYFMNLFFFISGVFVPGSFDRRGLKTFLREKFTRLGLPVLLWYLLLGPLLWTFTARVIFKERFYHGQDGLWVVRGPPWFIMWLLIYSVTYGFVDGPPVTVGPPTVASLLAVGLGLGTIQCALSGPLSYRSDWLPPFGVQQLVITSIFFAAGCLAGRNRWLEEMDMPKHSIWFLRTLTIIMAAAYLVYHSLLTVDNFQLYNASVHGFFMLGLFPVIFSFVLLDLFKHVNWTGQVLDTMASSAYTVFIIHPWVVVLVAWSCVFFFQACGTQVAQRISVRKTDAGAMPEFPLGPQFTFVLQGESDISHWHFALYTFVLSNVIVWPLAAAIKKLPGLKRIL